MENGGFTCDKMEVLPGKNRDLPTNSGFISPCGKMKGEKNAD